MKILSGIVFMFYFIIIAVTMFGNTYDKETKLITLCSMTPVLIQSLYILTL